MFAKRVLPRSALRRSQALWDAFSSETGNVMGTRSRTLAMMRGAAWAAGGGKGDHGRIDRNVLRGRYEEVNFVRSVTVDEIEDEIANSGARSERVDSGRLEPVAVALQKKRHAAGGAPAKPPRKLHVRFPQRRKSEEGSDRKRTSRWARAWVRTSLSLVDRVRLGSGLVPRSLWGGRDRPALNGLARPCPCCGFKVRKTDGSLLKIWRGCDMKFASIAKHLLDLAGGMAMRSAGRLPI